MKRESSKARADVSKTYPENARQEVNPQSLLCINDARSIVLLQRLLFVGLNLRRSECV